MAPLNGKNGRDGYDYGMARNVTPRFKPARRRTYFARNPPILAGFLLSKRFSCPAIILA